jgi:hypothetical protein
MKNRPTFGGLVAGVTKARSGVASTDPLFLSVKTPVKGLVSTKIAWTYP